jgi:hypothetical protein
MALFGIHNIPTQLQIDCGGSHNVTARYMASETSQRAPTAYSVLQSPLPRNCESFEGPSTPSIGLGGCKQCTNSLLSIWCPDALRPPPCNTKCSAPYRYSCRWLNTCHAVPIPGVLRQIHLLNRPKASSRLLVHLVDRPVPACAPKMAHYSPPFVNRVETRQENHQYDQRVLTGLTPLHCAKYQHHGQSNTRSLDAAVPTHVQVSTKRCASKRNPNNSWTRGTKPLQRNRGKGVFT